VKLYVEEEHSFQVREWVAGAEIVATCRVAYPEALSAFHRRLRAGELLPVAWDRLALAIADDWSRLATLDFDEREAGRLVIRHGLRGFDAVHLAAAVQLRQTNESLDLAFSSFDARQCAGATAEGLAVLTV
jgi:predicted nucleic acid-binding protein